MDQLHKDFLDMVSQVRTHLELQRALGVNWLPALSPDSPSQGPASHSVNVPVEKTPAVHSQPAAPVQAAALAGLQAEIAGCTRCALSPSRASAVFGEGDPEAVVVFVGDAPHGEEEEQGRPLAGAAGQLLEDIIVKGMKLKKEEVYICNVVKCRTPQDRKPDPQEIEACESILVRQLQAIKPKIIVALGNTAVNALLGTSEGITTLRGTWQTYQGIPVMPTFHPAHLVKKESDKKLAWEDIKKVMAALEKFPKRSKPHT